MPGHIKLGKTGEPDPDPSPYLVVSMEMKREAMSKPYDARKSYWCPAGDGGFTECMLESNEGGKAVVMVGHEVEKHTCTYLILFDFDVFRKRPSSLIWLDKLTLQSLRSVRTWLT